MKRADELFVIDRRPSPSPYVEAVWSTRSVPEASFISVAASNWVMVVTTTSEAAQLTVRGPETRFTIVPIPRDAHFVGIQFAPGTFMPSLRPGSLVDRSLTFPAVAPTSFWFNGSPWECARLDDAEAFVDRLVSAGLLARDPIVEAALHGEVSGLSTRSIERRVTRATGLSRGAIRQIHRAEAAVELLSSGVSAVETARRAGYSDQSHLTRSLKRLVGQTPSQVSLSFKTPRDSAGS